MLAPFDLEGSDPQQPFQQLCLAGLRCYENLDQELKDKTGIDIELMDAPTLHLAFDDREMAALQAAPAARAAMARGRCCTSGRTTPPRYCARGGALSI